MRQAAHVHRHRLGPAEHRRMGQRQHAGQKHGAHRIDMAQRIEAEPPLSCAVRSPSRRAMRPCATSWNTIATIMGMATVAS
jgi:hypothetical protein